MSRSVSRRRFVPAPATAVFDVLADPRMHPRLAGSGSLRAVVDGPGRLVLGSQFRMRMHFVVPYFVRNTVVEYDEGRRIAWRHFGGHRWRFELEPADGGTNVTETFDYSTARWPWLLEVLRFPAMNAKGIAATLKRLAAVLAQRETTG